MGFVSSLLKNALSAIYKYYIFGGYFLTLAFNEFAIGQAVLAFLATLAGEEVLIPYTCTHAVRL